MPAAAAENARPLYGPARGGSFLELDFEQTSLASRVYRWPHGVASYQVHHLERLQRLRSALADHPGLVLASAGYHGVGIPECRRQGEEASAGVLLHKR